MFLPENNVTLELSSLNTTAVTLTANGERWENHAVSDKEDASESPDVTTSTTVVPVFPGEQLLAAPSKEPKLKVTAALELVFPSDPNFKLSFHPHSYILTPFVQIKAPPKSSLFILRERNFLYFFYSQAPSFFRNK